MYMSTNVHFNLLRCNIVTEKWFKKMYMLRRLSLMEGAVSQYVDLATRFVMSLSPDVYYGTLDA